MKIRLTWGQFSTSLKPSEKGVSSSWLAMKLMSQAALTQSLGAGLHTGDLNPPQSTQKDFEVQQK